MRVGVKRTQAGAFARPDALVALVREVRDLGLDSYWLGDHIAFPTQIDSAHKAGAKWRTDIEDGFLEAVATAGWLLGKVDGLPIGVHAFIAPYRNPIVLGKSLATLDQLSGGRLRVALAAGWIEEVFPTVGAPAFASRGGVLEEYVGVLRAMWRDGLAEFAGEHFHVAPSFVRPTPAAGAGFPLILGGHAPSAVRRAGRLGDGWAAARMLPDELAASVRLLRETATAARRDPSAFEVVVEADLDLAAPGDDPSHPLAGPASSVCAALDAYRDAGATLLLLNPMSETLDGAVRDLRKFAAAARPALAPTGRT